MKIGKMMPETAMWTSDFRNLAKFKNLWYFCGFRERMKSEQNEKCRSNDTLLEKNSDVSCPKIDVDPVAGSHFDNRINSGICTGVRTLRLSASSRQCDVVVLGSMVFMHANQRKYTQTKIIYKMYNLFITGAKVIQI